jgi:hypothetical protein
MLSVRAQVNKQERTRRMNQIISFGNYSKPTSYDPTDNISLEYLDYHKCKSMNICGKNGSVGAEPTVAASPLHYSPVEVYANTYCITTPPSTNIPYEFIQKVDKTDQENLPQQQYAMTLNLFDPTKESPPNTFMHNLQNRIKTYYKSSFYISP